jgi:hypothetical protein
MVPFEGSFEGLMTDVNNVANLQALPLQDLTPLGELDVEEE